MSKKNEDLSQPQVKIVEKKRGGCGTFFMGFLFAFIFLFVSVGGAGLYLYYNVTLTQIENVLGVKLPIEGDVRDKSVKELISLGLQYKSNITDATLESLNTTWGVELPSVIPGTSLDISNLYNEDITFLGKTQHIKKFRIQDIVNNLNEFVDAVLPKVYDSFTVGQILETLNTTIIDDLNYPALTEKYYNVSTTKEPELKTLKELTISQAFKVIPEYFGSDNLTVQEAIDAFGLSILPKPTGTEPDIYANLRTQKITTLTTDILLTEINGEILNSLVDLSSLPFTQETGFKTTNLKNMLDYVKTVPLGQIVNINTPTETSPAGEHLLYALRNATYNDLQNADVITTLANKIDTDYADLTLSKIVDFSTMENLSFLGDVKLTGLLTDATTTLNNVLGNAYIGDFITLDKVANSTMLAKSQFANIPANTLLSNVKEIIQNLTISQIFTESDLTNFTETEKTMTVAQFLDNNSGTFKANKSSIDYASYGGYVEIFSETDATTYATTFEGAGVMNCLGNGVSALAGLSELNFKQIADSEDAINLLISKFGTLADFFGGEQTGLFGILAEISVQDLFNNATQAINNALTGTKAQSTTLKEFLNLSSEVTDPIITSIMNVTIADMFSGNPTNAIKTALAGSAESPNTLGSMLNITDTTGIMSYIKNVKFGDLLGLNGEITPSKAIINALTANDTTLGDLVGITETNGVLSLIKTIPLSKLLTEGANAGQAIMNALTKDADGNNITLGTFLNLGTTTGFVGKVASITMADLLAGGSTASTAISGLINQVTLADVFTAPEDTKSIMYQLYNFDGYASGLMPIKDIMTNINSIKLSSIITQNEKTKIFNLIDDFANLTIDNLCSGTFNLKTLTVEVLYDAGFLTGEKSDYASILTYTIQDLVDTAK